MSHSTPTPVSRAVRWLDLLVVALGSVVIALAATVPLSGRDQAVLGGGAVVAAIVASLLRGRTATLFLIALSAAVTLRYLFWRVTQTTQFASPVEAGLGWLLLIAEIYAAIMLVLGYVTTGFPLGRLPRALPPAPADWPAVDVFVTVVDEPLALVRATVLAALAMDWPASKMEVWLLDDGNRAEMAELAAACGCRYLARGDRADAKAGNLNHGLAAARGEHVAVFDSDHAPTRAFLQLTVGWLVAEPNLAFVQTRQHFRIPDVFQRNLVGGGRVPPEPALFHGLVQDGNDTWNAAMFTGTGAVLRREALDSVGGFATGTVVEDALTTLRLHRNAWDSAYLNLPLSAGLPPLRLGHFLAQRRRWAAGLLRILRVDHPLLGRGLSLGQRLCHFQAAAHFLFAPARIAFLLAPAVALLGGLRIYSAAVPSALGYAMPHLVLAAVAGVRLQHGFRAMLWGQLYETVAAWHLLGTVAAAVVAGGRRRFGVTPKAAPIFGDAIDLACVWPNMVLALVLIASIVQGCLTLGSGSAWVAVNIVWAAFSLLLALAAVSAGREVPARAAAPADLPTVVRWGGAATTAMVTGLSQEGALVMASMSTPPALGDDVAIEIALGDETLVLPGRLLAQRGEWLEIGFRPANLAEQTDLVRAVFGRADAWVEPASGAPPAVAIWSLLISAVALFRRWSRVRAAPRRARVGLAVGLAVAIVLPPSAGFGQAVPAPRPRGGTVVRPVPQPVPRLLPQGDPAPPSVAPASPLPPQPPAPRPATPPPEPRPPSRQVVLSLHDLGAPGPLALSGVTPVQGVTFGIRADEVATAAELHLVGNGSAALLPSASGLRVTLDNEPIGTVAPPPEGFGPGGFVADLPIMPSLLRDDNRLDIRFVGRLSADCEDPLNGLLWAAVSDLSTLTLTLERLPPRRDLARLPRPFVDPRDRQRVSLPFVLHPETTDAEARAAGIVAGWFGTVAGAAGIDFPVVYEDVPPQGNAVLFLTSRRAGDALGVTGPTIALDVNPHDPFGTLLVVAGRTDEELVAAAQALAAGSRTLGGEKTTVQKPERSARAAYDAPNWLRGDRPTKLSELVDPADLQAAGYAGLFRVPFRVAPDLVTWGDRPLPLALRWRAPGPPVIGAGASRLDVGVNGQYVDTLGLSGGGAARVGIPPAQLGGANELQLFFDARPERRETCGAVPGDLRIGIDPESTIDPTGARHHPVLPDLAGFAAAGLPFTRLADLSDTAVVLPERPDVTELGVFLDLLGRWGGVTGVAGTEVAVVRPGAVRSMAARDLVLIGTFNHLGAAAALLARAPLRLDGARLALSLGDPLGAGVVEDARRAVGLAAPPRTELSAGVNEATIAIVGAQSPLAPGRSLVALLAATGDGMAQIGAVLGDPARAAGLRGDLALLSGGQVSTWRVGETFEPETLPWWWRPDASLRGVPLATLALLLGGCVLVAIAGRIMLRRRVIRPHVDRAG